MSKSLSPNAQAILLLTAPLIAGQGQISSETLTPGEYKRLARLLREKQRQPADLLAPDAGQLLADWQSVIDSDRIKRLLDRGFLMSQAVERWQARAIWVVSRADVDYPRRLKASLQDDAPPLIYGCGESPIWNTVGLAVVGSRNVDDELMRYAEDIGQLAAKARYTLYSGGARGIDQAAMRGALDAGGKAVGVLADSLEKLAMNRDHRTSLMEGQLVLISPYDPAAGFNVGHAMQRNKLIYALSNAALVVNSDYEKGGTWAGAVEQLEKLHFVPVFVRASGEIGKGLEALQRKGALPWPSPATPQEFIDAMNVQAPSLGDKLDKAQSVSVIVEKPLNHDVQNGARMDSPTNGSSVSVATTPADNLFAIVKSLVVTMNVPKTDLQVASELNVSKSQAKLWLERLVKEGVLTKLPKPVRYCPATSSGRLF